MKIPRQYDGNLLTDADAGMLLTRAQFRDAEPEPRFRLERVASRLVVSDQFDLQHHTTLEPLRDQLGLFRVRSPTVMEHVFQSSWTAIDEETDRIADLAVFLTQTTARKKPFPHWVPDIVFEIVSAGWENRRRDYQEKRDEYERIGVREYVIVDRFDHLVTVLTLTDGHYVQQCLGPNDSYTSPQLPGLTIPLQEVIGA